MNWKAEIFDEGIKFVQKINRENTSVAFHDLFEHFGGKVDESDIFGDLDIESEAKDKLYGLHGMNMKNFFVIKNLSPTFEMFGDRINKNFPHKKAIKGDSEGKEEFVIFLHQATKKTSNPFNFE